jgi:hypothetical protein
MADIATAFAAIRARLEAAPAIADAHGNTLPFRWQGTDGGALPDDPAAFAFVELENFGPGRGPAAFGGGRGANLYRNEGLVTVYVFTPNGEGIDVSLATAESVAARLRSHREDSVSCFSASVHPIGDGASLQPPGLSSPVNAYYCSVVEAAMHFDQIG